MESILARDFHDKFRTFADFALYVNGSAVSLDDPFGDGQTESMAALLARPRFVDAVEAVENAVKRFRGNADPGVFDGDREHWLFRWIDGNA